MRLTTRLLLATIALMAALLSCRKTSPPAEESKPETIPSSVMLLVEREITGGFNNIPLKEPFGLTVGRDGYIYLVDRGNNRVLRLTLELQPDKQIGGYGLGTESFSRPSFVTMDNGLNLYIADEGNRRVARFDARLNYVDEIQFTDEEDPFKFGYPSGIGVNSYGEVWVADREKNRLAVFNNVGKFDRFLGEFGSPEGQLLSPEKIFRDIDKRFYICDAGHRRIVIYDEFGSFLDKILLSDAEYPIAATRTRAGFWVTDDVNARILLMSRKGSVIAEFGPTLPGNDRPLNQPGDLVILENDRLLIADSGNNRLLLCRIESGTAR